MFQLSETLLNRPVMSLRTSSRVSETLEAIINPNNLKIEGFYCTGPNKKQRLVLLSQDIRDILSQGIVVNDHDVLSPPEELVRLKDIIGLNFSLVGKPVFSTNKNRIGRVSDYAVEIETMFIQKIYVSQPVIKSFSGGGLSVDRGQIVEITNRKIVIQDPQQGTRATGVATAPIRT